MTGARSRRAFFYTIVMSHRLHSYRLPIIALLFCAHVWPWSATAQAPGAKNSTTSKAVVNAKQTKETSKAEAKSDDAVRTMMAKEDLQAQKDQARYALCLVFIGAITAAFLIYQLILLRRQIKGALAEFNATHRPRIIVRRVSLNNAQRAAVPDNIGAEFLAANIGDTPAKIIEVSARLWLTEPKENLPAIPPYGERIFHGLNIEPGESKPFTHFESAEVSNETNFRDGFLGLLMNRSNAAANSGMLFLGYVVYEDGNKIKRRTAFLREYRYDLRRFEPIYHPDYEYQD